MLNLLAGRCFLVLASVVIIAAGVCGDEPETHRGRSSTAAIDGFFADEVWAKVASRKCLICHRLGGDAEESKLVLRDPQKSQPAEQSEVPRHNFDAFLRAERMDKFEHDSRLLRKVTGELDRGGAEVLQRVRHLLFEVLESRLCPA